MLIYFGRSFETMVRGEDVKHLACDRCQTRFSYVLFRSAKGSGHSAFMADDEGAQRRAGSEAHQRLADRLAREAEMVPCPQCHWVNVDLVHRYRNRLYRRLLWLSVPIIFCGLIASLPLGLLLRTWLGPASDMPLVLTRTWIAICLLSPVWLAVLRQLLRARVDPNRTFPQSPLVPPGTPPALVTTEASSRSVETQLVAVESAQRNPTSGWVLLRSGQFPLPEACAICLEPPSATHQLRSPHTPPVPLCRACSSRAARRWWMYVAAAGLTYLGGIFLLYVLFETLIPEGAVGARNGAVFFGVLAGPFIVPAVASRLSRPYRLVIVDSDRGIVKFQAPNPAYMGMVNRRRSEHEKTVTLAPVPPSLPKCPTP